MSMGHALSAAPRSMAKQRVLAADHVLGGSHLVKAPEISLCAAQHAQGSTVAPFTLLRAYGCSRSESLFQSASL
jgi:hypothetical protein